MAVDRRRHVEVRVGDRPRDRPRREALRERDDGDPVQLVLDDVERPAVEQQAVAVRHRRTAEADRLRRAGRGGDRKSFPVALCTTTSVLPSGRRVDAVQVEARDELEVAGQRDGLRGRGGSAVLRERDAVEDRAVRVGEVRGALRDDDVVDEGRSAAASRAAARGRARRCARRRRSPCRSSRPRRRAGRGRARRRWPRARPRRRRASPPSRFGGRRGRRRRSGSSRRRRSFPRRRRSPRAASRSGARSRPGTTPWRARRTR